MAIYTIRSLQRIPVTTAEAWRLFANPMRLGDLTPPGVGFRMITKDIGTSLHEGQILEYRIKPLLGLPFSWKTEVMEVRESEYFSDEQRKGPFRYWRHEHYFKAIEGGMELMDLVRYQNPFGFIGVWANGMLVRKKLREIFEFRFRKTEEILGGWKGQKPEIFFTT